MPTKKGGSKKALAHSVQIPSRDKKSRNITHYTVEGWSREVLGSLGIGLVFHGVSHSRNGKGGVGLNGGIWGR